MLAAGSTPSLKVGLGADLDAVLAEGVVEAAGRGIGHGIEGARRVDQGLGVACRRLDPQAAHQDAVAVAIPVGWIVIVIERMGIPEGPARVRIGALRNRAVGLRHPDFGIRRAEDVAAAQDDAVLRDLHAHALAAVPSSGWHPPGWQAGWPRPEATSAFDVHAAAHDRLDRERARPIRSCCSIR